MPPKTLARAGIAAVVIAILVPWGNSYWLKTRIFDPVDMPVSLDARQIQTGEFEINLREDYAVYVSLDYSPNDRDTTNCSYTNKTGFQWKIYRFVWWKANKGELWATSDVFPHILPSGGFHAAPGKYQLEWDVPAGATCLNALHPRLHVSTTSTEYEWNHILIRYACLFLGGTGAMLLLRALGGWLLGDLAAKRALRMFPEMVVRNVLPLQRHRQIRLIKDLPNFGMVWGCLLFTLLVIYMIVSSPKSSLGLRIDIGEQNAGLLQKSPWTETLGVYVDGQNQFYVNGQLVPREKLGTKLQEELGRRMVWTVYFEADRDCVFMEAAHAIDTIQGIGAKVVWITPSVRAKLSQTGSATKEKAQSTLRVN